MLLQAFAPGLPVSRCTETLGCYQRRKTDDREHRHLGDYEFDEDIPRDAPRNGRDRGETVLVDGVQAFYKKSFTEDPWAELMPEEAPLF